MLPCLLTGGIECAVIPLGSSSNLGITTYTGGERNNLFDVLDRFEAYFRPQHMIHAWYRIGTTFSDSEVKTQSEFMYKLKDLAKQCEFTNSDEVGKFLILIHNKHVEVKQELLK